MGICASGDATYKASAAADKKLAAINRNDFAQESKRVKLLLLGAGESGKSTIFKQMKIIYGKPFTLEERKNLLTVIHANVIGNVRALVKGCGKVSPLTDPSLELEMAKVPESDELVMDAGMVELFKKIWNDKGAQTAWTKRADFQVQDALEWYMAEIDRLVSNEYVPSVDDILRARVRTSGIVEDHYMIDNIEFVMYDVGGQRNERKKWVHCFDNVTAVIFVAAISEYDQVLYEDDQMFRMDEAVMLFSEMCNLKHFVKTSMILFLNKNDLFRSKLPVSPVENRYPDFQGPFVTSSSSKEELDKNYEAAVSFFLDMFLRRNSRPNREIYHHVTCATDTSNIKVVFGACKDIILKNNLKGSGFMD